MGDKSFSCKKCHEENGLFKYFKSQYVLNKHLRRSHGPFRFTCQVCSKKFRQGCNFEKHERTHNPNMDQTLICELCTVIFCSKQSLQKHLFNVHKKKTAGVEYFPCELCSLEFVNRPSLERHVVDKHVVDKEFACCSCSSKFIDEKTLDKHFSERHGEVQIRHFCDICRKGFKYKKSLTRHLGVEHMKFCYCVKCLKSFSNKFSFDEHLHPKTKTTGTRSESLEFSFKCKICKSESFDSQCKLDTHTNHHSKIVQCEKTNRADKIKTTHKNAVVKPQSSQLSEKKQVKCQFCSKTFDHESYLQPHRNIQHPDAEWTCSYENCSETFKQYIHLKKHVMKNHVERKPIVCTICQQSFKNLKNFRYHEKKHAVEKQNKCSQCTKSFVAPDHLKTHIAHNHGGPKPFKCPIKSCKVSCATTTLLNVHLVSHQTVKLLTCDMCPQSKGFKNLAYLKQHQRGIRHASRQRQIKKLTHPMISRRARAFICNSNECIFETVSEKEIAIHYNEQHQLPKVLIYYGL